MRGFISALTLYFGLRDYGTATWEGGDVDCQHSTGNQVNMTKDRDTNRDGVYSSGVRPGSDNSHCRLCGARRIDNQIGLEPDPESYVARLVDVFREVRRLLRDDGTVFLNLGDSYNGSGGAGGDYGPGGLKEGQPKYPGRNVNGLGPKQLLGMP